MMERARKVGGCGKQLPEVALLVDLQAVVLFVEGVLIPLQAGQLGLHCLTPSLNDTSPLRDQKSRPGGSIARHQKKRLLLIPVANRQMAVHPWLDDQRHNAVILSMLIHNPLADRR